MSTLTECAHSDISHPYVPLPPCLPMLSEHITAGTLLEPHTPAMAHTCYAQQQLLSMVISLKALYPIISAACLIMSAGVVTPKTVVLQLINLLTQQPCA
jgi:hypothetical protein